MKPKSFVFFLLIPLLIACLSKDKSKSTSPDASPDAVPNLVGDYVVNGFDPLGTEYGGHLTILPGDLPDEFKMQWILVGSIQEGDGMLNGNQLFVEWHSAQGMQETQGKAVYTVTEAGEIYGTKTVEGLETEGSEIAFPNE